MLSALEIVSKVLGYFNIKDKPKNRMFVVVGFLANFYLLYLAITNLRYAGYRIFGVGFLVAFLVILYFEVLNFFYYFTDKRLKFDISPWVEKKLGGRPTNAASENAIHFAQNVPSAGLFDSQQVLPVELSVSPQQKQNIETLAQQLIAQGYLTLNYNGLAERELYAQAQKSSERLYAMGSPLQLPYYALKKQADALVLYVGLNSLAEVPVGVVTKVGLTQTKAALQQYDLAVANSYLRGGPYKIAGRSGLVESSEPFEIIAEVAYQTKQTTE